MLEEKLRDREIDSKSKNDEDDISAGSNVVDKSAENESEGLVYCPNCCCIAVSLYI